MEPQKKITEFRLVVIPTPPFSCGYRAINIVLYLLNQDFLNEKADQSFFKYVSSIIDSMW